MNKQLLDTPLNAQQIKKSLSEMSSAVEKALKNELSSHVGFVEEVSQYVLHSPGKRIRPLLFLLVSKMLQEPAPARFSVVFEFLHAASLLHDDVVDSAGLRRGREAAHIHYGNPAVILVGDFLFAKSYHLASQIQDVRFARSLAECSALMAEGQVLELLHTDNAALSTEIYLNIIRAKTAELIASACKMAAIYAGQKQTIIESLYQYGLRLGLCFQLIDDALDYAGDKDEVGKPVGHDLREGKITYPFIFARDSMDSAQSKKLCDLANQSRFSLLAADSARTIVTEAGGVQATVDFAYVQALTAQQHLAILEPSPGKDVLLSLCEFVIKRQN